MLVVCKCTTARRSFFCFRAVSFDDKPDRRNLLRNILTLPVLKKGLFTCCSPSLAGNSILRIKALTVALKALKLAGVHGIAVEVWWGIVQRFSPLAYDWSLYEGLFKLISDSGLKLHVALSFHSNVNSSSSRKGGVTLPLWITEIGDQNKHIYYRDQMDSPMMIILHLELTMFLSFAAGLLSNVMKISCQVLLRNLNP